MGEKGGGSTGGRKGALIGSGVAALGVGKPKKGARFPGEPGPTIKVTAGGNPGNPGVQLHPAGEKIRPTNPGEKGGGNGGKPEKIWMGPQGGKKRGEKNRASRPPLIFRELSGMESPEPQGKKGGKGGSGGVPPSLCGARGDRAGHGVKTLRVGAGGFRGPHPPLLGGGTLSPGWGGRWLGRGERGGLGPTQKRRGERTFFWVFFF